DSLADGPREVAQAAAIVGRRFSRRVLNRVLQRDDLDESLAALLRADVIREAGGTGDREYVFRHGLFQDAALSTLTAATREQMYARVAAAVEDVFADSHDGHLEMLAHYYAQSRDLPKSLHFLELAGEKAAAL